MIDTDKYEGHTEGPWTLSEEYAYELFVYAGDVRLAKIDGNMENEGNEQLIADAPLLLAEVKRLRGVIYDALYVLQTDGWNKNRADAINRLEKILFKGWEGEEE